MITVVNLTKRYKKNEFDTISNISFSIFDNEIVGLVGNNGAGKTTLLSMLTKRLKPTDGKILFDNVNIYENNDTQKRVGILMEPVFFDHLSAYQNIEFYLDINGESFYKDKIHEIMKFVGLESVMNKSPKLYSFGMKQRLGLAMCLINDPDYLVMDEPFVGLDYNGVKELTNIILEWTKEKKITAIISSHQLHELKSVCNRFLYLNDGKICEIDDIEKLYY